MNKKTFKSIGAVLAGFLTVFILSSLADYILEAVGILPRFSAAVYLSPELSALALFYRTVFTVLGGYITARLAPTNPMRHVMVLGILGIIGGTLGVVATWSQNLGPRWYPILLAVLSYPSVWLGGKLATKKKS